MTSKFGRPTVTTNEGHALRRYVDQVKATAESAGGGSGAGIAPTTLGYRGWTFDPLAATGTSTFTTGTIYTAAVKVTGAGTLASVLLPIATAGSGLTGGYVGIYDDAGTRLAISADQSTAWGVAGNKTVAMEAATTSIAADAIVRIAVLAVGTTGPGVRIYPSGVSAAANIGLTRFATAGTGQTALPATLGALTSIGTAPLLLVA